MSTNPESAEPRPRIRWWPAIVIATLGAAYLAWAFLGEAASQQEKVVRSYPGMFFTVLLLVVWLVLFSRLPGRARLALFGLIAALVVAGFALFRIEGVSGNLVPVLSPRWSVERDFGATVDAAARGVTAPGPNDYPQFLGPRRDGKLVGPRLARDWQARPPREVWRHDVGEGWSSFAVVGDAAVTQELRGNEEVVVRYELTTGKTVWTHAYEASFVTTIGGSGPRATPTIADGKVYSLGATGILTCVDLAGGRLLWSRDVLAENKASLPEWGKSGSPLVLGDMVIVQAGGGAGKSLVAYHRESGDVVWSGGSDASSYSSPVAATLAGTPQILMVNQTSVAGHDPETGQLLWREEWPDSHPKAATPLQIADTTFLVSAGYGIGSRLLELRRGDDGGLSVAELWESRRLKSKFASMVLHEGSVYGLDDGVMVCLDPVTGERRWKRGRYGHGQLILVGDLILIQTEKGGVVLVEANAQEHRELGHLPALDSKTWNPPALSGRYLLVRNNREAVCYELPLEEI